MMKNYFKLFEGKSFILKSVLTGIRFINCVEYKCISLMNPWEIILSFISVLTLWALCCPFLKKWPLSVAESCFLSQVPLYRTSKKIPKAFSHFVCLGLCWTSRMAQTVKNLPAMQETQVRSLGWEDPLEQVRVKVISCVRLFDTPWTTQLLEFSRPEYWSG